MLSLRTFARSVPRFSRSVARTSLRQTTLAKPAIAQPWKQTIKPAYAAFSTASVFREPAGEGESTNALSLWHIALLEGFDPPTRCLSFANAQCVDFCR